LAIHKSSYRSANGIANWPKRDLRNSIIARKRSGYPNNRSGTASISSVAHRLVFHPSIPDDLARAVSFYEDISPALGDRFRNNVKRSLADISERPESFPNDVGTLRFARVNRFPYLIFFAKRDTHVSVVAIVHGSVAPEKWRGRTL